MKKNKKNQAQKIEKTNLVEGINNLIEEKTQKVEKYKKALKAEAKKRKLLKRPKRRRSRRPRKRNWSIRPRKRSKPTS